MTRNDNLISVTNVLYRLMRDHVPARVIEEAVAKAGDEDVSDDGYLANHAATLAARLLQDRDDWEPGA